MTACSLAATCLLVVSVPSVDDWTTEAAAEVIRQLEDDLRPFETVVEVQSLGVRTAADKQPWDESRVGDTRRFHYTVARNRFREESVSDVSPEPLGVVCWDGEKLMVGSKDRLVIWPEFQVVVHDAMPLFNGGVGHVAPLTGRRLSHYVRSADLLAVEEIDPTTIRICATINELESAVIRITIDRAVGLSPRLLQYVAEIRDESGDLKGRWTFTPMEWEEIDGQTFIRLAYRDMVFVSHLPETEGQLREGRSVYRRLSTRFVTVDELPETRFVLEPAPGTTVADFRNDLVWSVGSERITVSNVVYDTPEPIVEDPSGRLQELLEQATAVHHPVRRQNRSQILRKETVIWAPIALWTAVATFTGLLLWIIAKRRA